MKSSNKLLIIGFAIFLSSFITGFINNLLLILSMGIGLFFIMASMYFGDGELREEEWNNMLKENDEYYNEMLKRFSKKP